MESKENKFKNYLFALLVFKILTNKLINSSTSTLIVPYSFSDKKSA